MCHKCAKVARDPRVLLKFAFCHIFHTFLSHNEILLDAFFWERSGVVKVVSGGLRGLKQRLSGCKMVINGTLLRQRNLQRSRQIVTNFPGWFPAGSTNYYRMGVTGNTRTQDCQTLGTIRRTFFFILFTCTMLSSNQQWKVNRCSISELE